MDLLEPSPNPAKSRIDRAASLPLRARAPAHFHGFTGERLTNSGDVGNVLLSHLDRKCRPVDFSGRNPCVRNDDRNASGGHRLVETPTGRAESLRIYDEAGLLQACQV